MHTRSRNPEFTKAVLALVEAGDSYSVIAQKMKITRNTVCGLVHRHAIRKPGRRPPVTKMPRKRRTSVSRPRKPELFVEKYIAPKRVERPVVKERSKAMMRREIEEALLNTIKIQNSREY